MNPSAFLLPLLMGLVPLSPAPHAVPGIGPGITEWPVDPAPMHGVDDPTIANLRAFARLYGYVRYFHPSDEAAATDWDRLAVLGSSRVMAAATPDDLQDTLEDLFEPIAPTLRIHSEDHPPPPPSSALRPEDPSELEVVAWQHLGLGSGVAGSVYQSGRLNRERQTSAGSQPAVLSQAMSARDARGQTVRLTARVRAREAGARGQLWLRVDLEGGGMDFFDNMQDRPVSSHEWTEVRIEGPVHGTASRIVLGTITTGGVVDYADLRLEIRNEDRWEPLPLLNADFTDMSGGTPGAWHTGTPGWEYRVAPRDDGAQGEPHTPALRIAPVRFTLSGALFDEAPEAGEVVRRPLDRGLVVQLPLALYSRDGRTLGTPDADATTALEEALAEALDGWVPGNPSLDHTAMRLADVIVAWNVFQHFYPYFDVVGVDWDEVLTESLARALEPQTHAEFTRVLEWLVAGIEDGHGWVTGVEPPGTPIPVGVEQIEGEVVVVAASDASELRPGDVIESLDGRAANDVVDSMAMRFSGSPQWTEHRALSTFGSGSAGDSVEIEYSREGIGGRTFVARHAGTQRPTERRPDPIEELEPGIFYVNLDVISIQQFRDRVDELAAADGVVFDLRGYPNGTHMALTHLSPEPLQSAYWRIPKIIRPDRMDPADYQESRWTLAPASPQFDGRVAFITDGRAISYAESMMGIVEHYKLGLIIGGPTAGANGNVNPITLPGGHRISWTGMRVENHDRTLLHNVGIRPSIPLERTIQGVREGRDELLDEAILRVRGLAPSIQR